MQHDLGKGPQDISDRDLARARKLFAGDFITSEKPLLLHHIGKEGILITDRAVYSSFLAKTGRSRLPLPDMHTISARGRHVPSELTNLPALIEPQDGQQLFLINGREFLRSRRKAGDLPALLQQLRDHARGAHAIEPLPLDELRILAAQHAAANRSMEDIRLALSEAGAEDDAEALADRIETIRTRPRHAQGLIRASLGLAGAIALGGALFYLPLDLIMDFLFEAILFFLLLVGLLFTGLRTAITGRAELKMKDYLRELKRKG